MPRPNLTQKFVYTRWDFLGSHRAFILEHSVDLSDSGSSVSLTRVFLSREFQDLCERHLFYEGRGTINDALEKEPHRTTPRL